MQVLKKKWHPLLSIIKWAIWSSFCIWGSAVRPITGSDMWDSKTLARNLLYHRTKTNSTIIMKLQQTLSSQITITISNYRDLKSAQLSAHQSSKSALVSQSYTVHSSHQIPQWTSNQVLPMVSKELLSRDCSQGASPTHKPPKCPHSTRPLP